MLRNLRILFAAALVACAAAAYADPPARVGRLNYASGTVSFAPAEAPDQWVQAALNRPLITGDRLWTDNDGRAELHVASTAVRMGPQTSLDVLNVDDETLQLRLGQGTTNLRVRHLGRGEILEIATPSGAVVIKQPGSYRVSADPQSNMSRMAVNFGQAEIVTPAQTLTVPSGQIATVPVGGDVSFELASRAPGDDFDRWSAERDRREDRIASTRYVSRQMTGYEDLDQYGSWRTVPDYGAVWYPTVVAAGWAPYRYGHWVWISPWGWTWVDDAPWGFAPFHYGRWVYVDGLWGWAPGRVVARPVYAPALVAFVGGAGWSVSISSGPAVGWFPLGFHDPYIPSYRVSTAYVRNVNVTHVTNITNVVNIYNNSANVTNVRYTYRNNPRAVTVVPQTAFVSARPIAQSTVKVAPTALERGRVIYAKAPADPMRTSIAPERQGHRPPASAVTREVVAVTAPPKPAPQASFTPGGAVSALRGAENESRMRVLGRERAEVKAGDKAAPRVGQPGRAPQAGVSAPGPAARSTEAPQQPSLPTATQAAPSAMPRPPQDAGLAAEARRPVQADRVPRAAGAGVSGERNGPPTATQAAPSAVSRPPQDAGLAVEARRPGQAHRVPRAAGPGVPGERNGPPPVAVRGDNPKTTPNGVARPAPPAVTQAPAAAAPRTVPGERVVVPRSPPGAASDNRAADEARARARAAESARPREMERPAPPRREAGIGNAPQHAAVMRERPPQRAEAAGGPREMPQPRPAPQAQAPRAQPAPPQHANNASQRHEQRPHSQ